MYIHIIHKCTCVLHCNCLKQCEIYTECLEQTMGWLHFGLLEAGFGFELNHRVADQQVAYEGPVGGIY